MQGAAATRDTAIIMVTGHEASLPLVARVDQADRSAYTDLPHGAARAASCSTGASSKPRLDEIVFAPSVATLPLTSFGASDKASFANRPERHPMDKTAAIAFINAIPEGRWTTFSEVAQAAGGSTAHAMGQWLAHCGDEVRHPWRVLKEGGVVPPAWASADAAGRLDIPTSCAGVRRRLREEFVPLRADGTAREKALFRYSDWQLLQRP